MCLASRGKRKNYSGSRGITVATGRSTIVQGEFLWQQDASLWFTGNYSGDRVNYYRSRGVTMATGRITMVLVELLW